MLDRSVTISSSRLCVLSWNPEQSTGRRPVSIRIVYSLGNQPFSDTLDYRSDRVNRWLQRWCRSRRGSNGKTGLVSVGRPNCLSIGHGHVSRVSLSISMQTRDLWKYRSINNAVDCRWNVTYCIWLMRFVPREKNKIGKELIVALYEPPRYLTSGFRIIVIALVATKLF